MDWCNSDKIYFKSCSAEIFLTNVQVVEFCRNYRQLKSMGFAPATVAGALMRHRDDLAAATESCLSAQVQ